MSEVDPVLDLIPAFALGCLDENEAQQVQRHLGDCAICRAELATYRNVADQLALSVRQIAPPEQVKTRLMAQVSSSAQTHASRAGRGQGWLQGLIDRLGNAAPVWAIASLALVVVLVASNIFLWQQVRELRAAQYVPLQVVALLPGEAAPGAVGMLVISRDGEHGTLVVDKLPPLEKSQQYQLWLIEDGTRTSGGVFSVKEDGYASLWIGAPKALGSYQRFGITIEPEGGSLEPTGVRVLAGDL